MPPQAKMRSPKPGHSCILAKLDTSAKGGMAFAIQRQLKVPILYAGLGETADSLELFDREAFVDGILEGFQTASGA
jgi:fused signal recognition particle receptor